MHQLLTAAVPPTLTSGAAEVLPKCMPSTVPDSCPLRDGLVLPLDEIELRASRSSGPGGQHANVTASRVEAIFDVHASQALSEEQKARIGAPARPARDGGRAGHALPGTATASSRSSGLHGGSQAR